MNKNILVVDNDVDMEDVLSEIFRGKDYTIIFYEETEDIFELINKHKPKLILLDYNLNGINGGELCVDIKKNPDTASIPVILFSAYPRMIYSLDNYGYDAFIEKPFDIDELFHTIESYVINPTQQNNG